MVALELTRSGRRGGELKPSHGCLIVVIVLCLLFSLTTAYLVVCLLAAGVAPSELGSPAALASVTAKPAVLFASAVIGQICFLVSVPLAMYLSRLPLEELLALRKTRPSQLVLAAVGMLGAGLFGDVIILWLRQVLQPADSVLNQVGQVVQQASADDKWLMVIGFSILPAICEEALFRGVVFKSVIRRWGPAAAVCVTALLFGLVHADLLQSPAAIVLGLYLGMIRLLTGSLWPSVAAHFANNLVAMLLMLPERAGTDAAQADLQSLLWLGLAGLCWGLLILCWLRPADEQ